jgi:hypothetical protein
MYRSLAEPNTFCQSFIKYGSNIPDANKTTCVLGYNLNSSTDSVNVKIVGRNDLEVTLSAWGLWWWQNINSAGPARDSLMTIQTNNWGGYSVHFKRKQPGDVFLTCHNGHWRRVNGF